MRKLLVLLMLLVPSFAFAQTPDTVVITSEMAQQFIGAAQLTDSVQTAIFESTGNYSLSPTKLALKGLVLSTEGSFTLERYPAVAVAWMGTGENEDGSPAWAVLFLDSVAGVENATTYCYYPSSIFTFENLDGVYLLEELYCLPVVEGNVIVYREEN